MPFLEEFMKENVFFHKTVFLEAVFSKLDFLDSWALPEGLDEYGVDELEKLLSHYGYNKSEIYNGNESLQKVYLNPVVVQAEWNSFIRMMF